MAANPAVTILVVLFAMFGLPKFMAYLPDLDPLMVIVCIFGVLALLQKLGLVAAPEGTPHADSGFGGNRQSRREPARNDEPEDDPTRKKTSLLQDAERALQQNSYKSVGENARQVIDIDPESTRAWELLATAQKWEGKREEAAETVRKAQDLYEIDSEVLRALAKELSSHDSSATVAECAAKGDAFIAKRQYDLACECYTQAIEALGEKSESTEDQRLKLVRSRAECAQQLQDWSLCRKDATVLLESEPNDKTALLQRAAACEALEKFKMALDDARKLLSLDPKHAAANRIVHNYQKELQA